jgi:hypothetical protein
LAEKIIIFAKSNAKRNTGNRRKCYRCKKSYTLSTKEITRIVGRFECKHCKTKYKRGCFNPHKEIYQRQWLLLEAPVFKKEKFRKRPAIFDPICAFPD